jgi:hypothetical protein
VDGDPDHSGGQASADERGERSLLEAGKSRAGPGQGPALSARVCALIAR